MIPIFWEVPMNRLFLLLLLVATFFIASCDSGKLTRPSAGNDTNNNDADTVVIPDKDTALPDEKQDETNDETQDTSRPDETQDETIDETQDTTSPDETNDETVDESVDETPDVDDIVCNNECVIGEKQCDPANLNDSQICMKDAYGCNRWIFSEHCNVAPHPSYICEIGECKPDCVDECTYGITFCNGDKLMDCVMGPKDCTVTQLKTDCATNGQECEQLVGGGHCVNPEVEYPLGSSSTATQGGYDQTHLMKADGITMDKEKELTRFSFYFRAYESQNIFFFVYEWDNDSSQTWILKYASSPIAVSAENSPRFYESPPINLILEKKQDYAIGLFMDKKVRYYYNNGIEKDIGPAYQWGILYHSPNNSETEPPAQMNFNEDDQYTFPMKLYFR